MTPEEAAELVGAEIIRPLGGTAHSVVWEGRPAVLKRHVRVADRMAARRAQPHVERLHERGYPAPRTLVVAESEAALVIVTEWLPGTAHAVVDHDLIAAVTALLRLQRGAAAGAPEEPWGAFVLRALTEGLTPAEGFCLHATLRDHGPAAARLLERIKERARDLEPSDFSDADVIHGDLHHLNILRQGPRVTGVVDWDSARTGDAAFDLVTFAFCAEAARQSIGTDGVLWHVTYEQSEAAEEVLDAYAAFMALRQVDHAIRTGGDVRLWMSIAVDQLSGSV